MRGRLAADQALAGRLLLWVIGADRHAARLGLDARLALGVPAPGRPDEANLVFEVRDHLGEARQLVRVRPLEGQRSLVEPLLEAVELGGQGPSDPRNRHGTLLAR